MRPLSLNAILVIAGVCATMCVLAVPPATTSSSAAGSGQPLVAAEPVDQARIDRDATANLRAVAAEANVVFSVIDTVAATAVN